jgi:Na+-transporting methylmalonyl-CoA/oxaloacetate decarboxylase gamma subunit
MVNVMILADVVWADAWARTGMGFGVVFTVLLVLVVVLVAFGIFSRLSGNKTPKVAKVADQPAVKPAAQPVVSASDADKAAIATALYLYFQNVHDEESNVITIRHNANSAWHHELNPRYNS